MDIFNKSKIQANAIYAQAYTFLTEKFSQVGKVFSVSSAYGQILSVLSNLSSMILFFIEDSITELNINTASRENSIKGLARLTGHDATRGIAATGEISLTISTNPNIQGSQVIIPNFSKLKCKNNGKVYTLNLIDDQVRLEIGSGKTQYV